MLLAFEHQIGLDVAVAMVNPLPGQRVIAEPFWQGAICGKLGNNPQQINIQRRPVWTSRLALVVLLETAGTLNRPHGGQPEDRKSTRLNSSHLGISYAV